MWTNKAQGQASAQIQEPVHHDRPLRGSRAPAAAFHRLSSAGNPAPQVEHVDLERGRIFLADFKTGKRP